MATIRETLEIRDRFSASLNRLEQLGSRAARQTDRLRQSIEKYRDKAKEASNASLSNGIGNLLKVVGGAAAVHGFVTIADSLTLTEARLNAVKGDLADVAQLQDMVFAAAQRSRGSYTDMAASVASIRAQTGDLFGSAAEAVSFMETLNKQFVISGTSAAGIQSTMYNLTQALATGVLRGNDLQMVLSNAPALVQKIADYMGEPVGKIRELAQDGEITAEIVKNAIMGAAGDINKEFERMPMTFGQAMQMLKNNGIRALQPMAKAFTDFVNSENFQRIMNGITAAITVLAEIGTMALNALGNAVGFAADNFGVIGAILAALAIKYLVLQAVSVASALATAAAWAVANWPLLLIIGLIGGAIAAAVNMGATFEQIGQFIGELFGAVYVVVYNCFVALWNQVANFAEFFANVWTDPLGATVRLFTGTFDNILGMVEAVANAIDALTGSNLAGAVSGVREKLSGWVDANFGEKAVEIKRMSNIDTATTIEAFGIKGANLGAKIEGLGSTMQDMMGSLGDIGNFEIPDYSDLGGGKKANVGSVDKVKEAKLADEDVKIYRDLAERRYMANVELQTLAPNISVSIPESAAKNLTSEDVANKLKAILIQQQQGHTAVAH